MIGSVVDRVIGRVIGPGAANERFGESSAESDAGAVFQMVVSPVGLTTIETSPNNGESRAPGWETARVLF